MIFTGLLPVSDVFRTLGLGEECTVIVHGDGKEPEESQEAQAMTIQSQRACSKYIATWLPLATHVDIPHELGSSVIWPKVECIHLISGCPLKSVEPVGTCCVRSAHLFRRCAFHIEVQDVQVQSEAIPDLEAGAQRCAKWT